MKRKINTTYILLGAGLAVGALFALLTRKKKPTPEPITPEPTPKPTPQKEKPVNISGKIAQLQNLMIKRFEQLNRSTEYNAAAARGGWGNLSTAALKKLQPANLAAKGIPTAQNIDFWIASINKDVETAAKEIQSQQQKKKSDSELTKLSEQYAAHFNAGKDLQIATNFTAVEHVFDNVKQSWRPTDKSRNFYKGNKFNKNGTYNRAQSRGNGQFFFVDGSKYFPTSPSNLIAL